MMAEKSKRVLVIEDDKSIAELVQIHLNDMDCDVVWKSDGKEGLMEGMENVYDLIVLDLMLPGKDGLEVSKSLRAEKVRSPILMLTSKSEEIDKVLGLESGADDYMTKPFSIREFVARVRAIFRRIELDQEEEVGDDAPIRIDKMVLDIAKRKLTMNENRIDLTPKEFDLLTLLAKNPGVTYSRERILNLIWGFEFEGFEHTVNSHINRLRAKMEKDMSKPKYILTTWGVGYRFNDEL